MVYPIQVIGSRASGRHKIDSDWDGQIISNLNYNKHLNIKKILNRHEDFMRELGCDGAFDLWLIMWYKGKRIAVKDHSYLQPYKEFKWKYCL